MVTTLEYDQYTKWLKKVTEDYGTGKLNYATQYTYDEVGNLKTVTNARSKVTTYTYDDADRLTQASYPDSTSEAWTYHDDGRVATHRDGRNRTITYHYDADDRLATVGTLKAVDYPTDTDVGIVRDKDGLVTSLADATGTSAATYYPSGWLKTFTNGASSLNKTTFEYNHVGLLSKLTAPVTSKYFTYTYNALNELSTVQDSSTPPITLSSFSYDNGGRLSRITRPGSYIEFAYNARDWIAAVRNRKTDDTVLYDNTYYYQDGSLWDFVGNPLKRTELVDGTTYTTTYRYDNVYRMLSEARTPGNYSLAYTYDQVGNRLTRVKDGVTTSYGYDNNDKLTTVNSVTSAGYDGSGNLTSTYGNFPAMTLAYNDASQLTSVAYPGGTDTFQWNALGQRMRANLNGTVFRYIYAGDRVLERTDDTGGTLARYTPADASYYAPLLYFKHNDGTQHYPMADIVGTSRRLLSESATVTDTYSLDAFGRQMSSTGTTVNPYRFGAAWGYLTDTPGSGLLQLGARFYWPEVGRFIQQDPIGDGMNWYAYAGNDPLVSVDPEGEKVYAPWDPRSTLYHVFTNDEGAWSAAPQGLAAGLDGFIPFWDPFRGSYDPCDPYLQASRAMGGVTRDAMLAAAVPNLGTWLRNPVLYEIGQMTVPARVYTEAFAALGPIQKGAYLVSNYGLRGLPALTLEAARTGQFAQTAATGLTPGGWLALIGGLHVADRSVSGRW